MPTDSQSLRGTLRTMVRSCYDLQQIRIQMGNRIAGNFRSKLGQKAGMKEEEMEEESIEILDTIRASHKKLTDGIKIFPKRAAFIGDAIITSYTELCLVQQYVDIEKNEKQHFARLTNTLEDFPIYTEFLEKVGGCGAAMAGVIISEIDIHKAQYPSSIWAYAGYDVASDGKARSRRAEHLVTRKYINKEGKEAERQSITYNPWLRVKLFVLAGCFLKAGSEFRIYYDNYKHRLEHTEKWMATSKGHRHMASMRYMMKRFLCELYIKWRTLEGLPVAPEYSEAKLGKVHKLAG